MRSELLHREFFVFNKKDNGGESLTLTTEYHNNGDGVESGIYLNQKLTLCSYHNSATFDLSTAILTPENLRELANLIEQGRNKAISKLPKWNK